MFFVRLPGRTFDMGSPPGERGRKPNEGPVHRVTLSPFLIAKYEVTQAQWKAVLDDNPSMFFGDDLPVEVSSEDSQRFCDGTGLSLPSEAQWEYACRAGRFWVKPDDCRSATRSGHNMSPDHRQRGFGFRPVYRIAW